ncbi:hypothetical protein SCLCIDRAFT_130146, partial [Scleroderma citrinum Foug A]
KCYKLFKKEHPDTWQDILIKFEDSTHYTETGKTASQQQQLFNKSVKCFTQLFSALLKVHGIKGAFVMVGSIVNQDASLGHMYTTPSTEDFFMERCHADNDAIISHFKAHIYNRSSLACLTEAFNTDKSDKGKGKEQDNMTQDVIDLMSDNERHGQSWASGKLFPWKQLLQKFGQNALVCVNWLAVLFPGQECSSCSKPKGISNLTIVECTQIVTVIRDSGPHRLHFQFEPFSKHEGLSSCCCS